MAVDPTAAADEDTVRHELRRLTVRPSSHPRMHTHPGFFSSFSDVHLCEQAELKLYDEALARVQAALTDRVELAAASTASAPSGVRVPPPPRLGSPAAGASAGQLAVLAELLAAASTGAGLPVLDGRSLTATQAGAPAPPPGVRNVAAPGRALKRASSGLYASAGISKRPSLVSPAAEP